MGDTTRFNGILEFTKKPTVEELRLIKSISGEDARDHEEWGEQDFYYLDLQVDDDITGIEHTDVEKSYGVVEQVNFPIKKVKEISPDFGLKGSLMAQGENVGDVWRLRIKDGLAVKEDVIEDDNCKWISVADGGVPPYEQPVLIVINGVVQNFTYSRNESDDEMWFEPYFFEESEFSVDVSKVTHWQPLPEPPKGEDNE